MRGSEAAVRLASPTEYRYKGGEKNYEAEKTGIQQIRKVRLHLQHSLRCCVFDFLFVSYHLYGAHRLYGPQGHRYDFVPLSDGRPVQKLQGGPHQSVVPDRTAQYDRDLGLQLHPADFAGAAAGGLVYRPQKQGARPGPVQSPDLYAQRHHRGHHRHFVQRPLRVSLGPCQRHSDAAGHH